MTGEIKKLASFEMRELLENYPDLKAFVHSMHAQFGVVGVALTDGVRYESGSAPAEGAVPFSDGREYLNKRKRK